MDEYTHGGRVFNASRELGLPVDEILDFSANINPLGFPSGVDQTIRDHIKDIVHYPDQGQEELLAGAARAYQVPTDCILAGNGSAELIHIVVEALRPDRAIIPSPTFSEYAHSCRARDIPVDLLEIPSSSFTIDDGFIEDVVNCSTPNSLVILCNPNNPTGQMVDKKGVLSMLRGLEKKRSYLMVDEAFMDFTDESNSMREYIQSDANLMVLRSLTKFFALPGLRIGFLLAPSRLISRFERLKDPWNINTFAGIVTPQVMEDMKYISETKGLIAKEKEWLWRKLNDFEGFAPLPPAVNYVFVEMTGEILANDLAAKLKRRGILVRQCCNYPFLDQRHFRVAVKDRHANERLVEAIEVVLGEMRNG